MSEMVSLEELRKRAAQLQVNKAIGEMRRSNQSRTKGRSRTDLFMGPTLKKALKARANAEGLSFSAYCCRLLAKTLKVADE